MFAAAFYHESRNFLQLFAVRKSGTFPETCFQVRSNGLVRDKKSQISFVDLSEFRIAV